MEGVDWLTGKQVMRQVRRHTDTALLINKKQEVGRPKTGIYWQQLNAQGRRPLLPRVQKGFNNYALYCPQTCGRKLLACCGSVPRHCTGTGGSSVQQFRKSPTHSRASLLPGCRLAVNPSQSQCMATEEFIPEFMKSLANFVTLYRRNLWCYLWN